VSAIDVEYGCGELQLQHDVVRRYVVFVRHRLHCDIDLRVGISLFRAKGRGKSDGVTYVPC